MKAELIVTIVVGLLLSGAFCWGLCAASDASDDDADQIDYINERNKEKDGKTACNDKPTDAKSD